MTSKNSTNLKILLVEDDLINQKVATLTFKKFGHEIDIIDNGIEAIEKYKSNNYDIIFMDLHMPKLGGIETAIRIRKYEKDNSISKAVVIFAMTANIADEEEEQCNKAGMNGFISKPFHISDIEDALELASKISK